MQIPMSVVCQEERVDNEEVADAQPNETHFKKDKEPGKLESVGVPFDVTFREPHRNSQKCEEHEAIEHLHQVDSNTVVLLVAQCDTAVTPNDICLTEPQTDPKQTGTNLATPQVTIRQSYSNGQGRDHQDRRPDIGVVNQIEAVQNRTHDQAPDPKPNRIQYEHPT
ncbi:hypothetical protein WICPIJ_003692 [Wickerhamomyces pijperi]|uniref:Uncharacterized protein n=1 Tax=Wickerhamomyces pijperi TaxID=599730 RepID=A0A9P8TNM8_WICPI|nr:hypothetical protein WICPIJ_003692 [Wickerhamomyces pijperi]